jgi:hypothetical protein
MPYDVFISYSSKDAAIAELVRAALEELGIGCWIAPRDIAHGQPWAVSILDGITACRVMVLIFSSEANFSPQIVREVERAVHQSMPILPLKIDSSLPSGSMELFISTCHWLDASTPPIEPYLAQLTHSVRSLLDSLALGTTDSGAGLCPSLNPSLSSALRHTELYESTFATLTDFDDNPLPRDTCGISRSASRPESGREGQGAAIILAPPPALPEEELITELATGKRKRIWLQGSGGIGKTEFSRLCALRLAQHFRRQPATAPVPVRVELKSLDPGLPSGGADQLVRNHLAVDEWTWLQPYLNAGRVAFILDGLDELRLDRPAFYAGLVRLMQQRRDCIFVITGRGESINPELIQPHCFERDSAHTLAEITLEQSAAYLDSLFCFHKRSELAAPLTAALREDSMLRELLCRSPLFLTMAGQVRLAGHAVSSNPLDLIERGLSVLFERRRSRLAGSRDELPEDATCFSALSCLAAHSLPGPNSEGSLTMTRSEAIARLREHRAPLSEAGVAVESEEAARRLVLQLTPGSGVLGWSGRDCLAFGHRVVAEYLAARWVAEEGGPHLPNQGQGKPYTLLPDTTERRIADFYGDIFWSPALRSTRYWLLYILHRRRPALFTTLFEWQVSALGMCGARVLDMPFLPDDWLRTGVARALNVVRMLRSMGQERQADQLFDRLAGAIGLETLVRLEPDLTIAECSASLMPEYLCRHYLIPSRPQDSKLAYQMLPFLTTMFNGVKDNDGRLLTALDVWKISLAVALDLLAKNATETGRWATMKLLDRGLRKRLTEVETSLITCFLSQPELPPLEFRLLDILLSLLEYGPGHVPLLPVIRHMREHSRDKNGFEFGVLNTILLLGTARQSDDAFVVQAVSFYLAHLRENWQANKTRWLRDTLRMLQPSARLLERLIALPVELLDSGQVDQPAADILAEAVVDAIASAKNIDYATIEKVLPSLLNSGLGGKQLADLVMRIKTDGPSVSQAKSFVVTLMETEFWKEPGTNTAGMAWLMACDAAAYQDLRAKLLTQAEAKLARPGPDAVAMAHRFYTAREVLDILKPPFALHEQARARLVEAIREYGQDLASASLWKRFEQEAPHWPHAPSLLAAEWGFSEPTHQRELMFWKALIEWLRSSSADHEALAGLIVEQLCSIMKEHQLDWMYFSLWLPHAPKTETLRQFILQAISARMDGCLIIPGSLIQSAAQLWPDDAEIRSLCLRLVLAGAASVEHESVFDQAMAALLNGWPGALDVLQGVVEAGRGHLVNESRAWDRWLIFWESEGTTAWLPECVTGFQRVPVRAGSARGTLILGLRDSARRGLPEDLLPT